LSTNGYIMDVSDARKRDANNEKKTPYFIPLEVYLYSTER